MNILQTAILSGDVIGSTDLPTKLRQRLESGLWELMKAYNPSQSDYYISRGDAFQLKVDDPAKAVITAIGIRCRLKNMMAGNELVDARISIGIGDISLKGKSLSSSDGSAFQRSGRGLDELKDKELALKITTGHELLDRAFEALCFMADEHIRHWSHAQAEAVLLRLQNMTYKKMAEQLQINPSAAYNRLEAAHWKAVSKLDDFFRFAVSQLDAGDKS